MNAPAPGPSGSGEGGAANRARAARAVHQVLEQGQTLETALADQLPAEGSPRDRAHVQALAFGAVRWHHRHQAILERLLDRPLQRRDHILGALLSVGLYQLADPAQADHAAVSATVAATRLLGRDRATGLVNGVLRRYQREAGQLGPALDATPEWRHSHPAWLVERLRQDWPDHWSRVLAANQAHPAFWLRVRTGQVARPEYQARLQAAVGDAGTTLAGLEAALKLERPVAVGRLPGFAAGLVSVQDAASQLAAPLLAAGPGLRVLDACAAPGGKAGHLLELASVDLTALDMAAPRLELVRANLRRLGLSARLVTGDATAPASWWDGQPFDRILVDAPCSASGVIRRHPDIKLLRRPEDLPGLARRQRLMLDRLWPLLRPGGRLLYSTCSVFREENGAVVGGFLADQPGARLLPLAPGLPGGVALDGAPGLQLLPGPGDTDGFYYALMEKTTG